MPFTETSKHLQEFVKDLAATESTKMLKKTLSSKTPMFSDKSAKFLGQIYKQLVSGIRKWQTNSQAVLSSLNINDTKTALINNESYNLIPTAVKRQIEATRYITYMYHFRIGARTVEACIVFPYKFDKSVITKKANKAISRIYIWLQIAFFNAANHCSNTLRLFFYMSDHLKIKPDVHKEPLNWVHANTAFTTPCQPATNITLFREEEWFKVFIHETFHCMGLDFSTFDAGVKPADKLVLQRFKNVNIQDLRLYETYCEMWAEILNTMFIAHSPTADFNAVIRKMEKMLKIEQVWSGFQCAKILNHHQLKYRDIIATNTNSNANRNVYTEKTNAFCYYVLKPILLFNIDHFVRWVGNQGNTLQFQLTVENTMDYARLIVGLYNNPEYLEYMVAYDEWYREHTHNRGDIMNTMRMTVNESV